MAESTPPPTPVVLLINDGPLVLDLLETALEDAGYAVLIATNDEEAFAAVEAEGARNFAGALATIINKPRGDL